MMVFVKNIYTSIVLFLFMNNISSMYESDEEASL